MRLSPKIFIFSFFAGFLNCVVAETVSQPTGTDRGVVQTDFFKHAAISDDFNEMWSYQFVFDNGTRAYVNYATLHIPGSGEKVGCDISFTNFKGKNQSVGRQYPPERLKEDKSKIRISVKEEYAMEGMPGKGHRVLFSANKNGKFLLDVTFESAQAGKVPGNGIWKIGEEKHAEYILIPYGRVKGKIAFNSDTIEVSGYGYMEHTWQTTDATKLAERAFNFSSPSTKAFAGRLAVTSSGNPFGYVIHNGKTLLPQTISENGRIYSGKEFPKGPLKILWANSSDALTIDMSHPKEKFSLLNNFDGWIVKKAAKLMMGGEIFFWRGRSKNPEGLIFDWSITGL